MMHVHWGFEPCTRELSPTARWGLLHARCIMVLEVPPDDLMHLKLACSSRQRVSHCYVPVALEAAHVEELLKVRSGHVVARRGVAQRMACARTSARSSRPSLNQNHAQQVWIEVGNQVVRTLSRGEAHCTRRRLLALARCWRNRGQKLSGESGVTASRHITAQDTVKFLMIPQCRAARRAFARTFVEHALPGHRNRRRTWLGQTFAEHRRCCTRRQGRPKAGWKHESRLRRSP